MSDRAAKIGANVVANEARWKAIQEAVGAAPYDGWPGNGTVSAIEKKLGIEATTPAKKPKDVPKAGAGSDQAARQNWPKPDYQSMKAFYGAPGTESNLVRVTFPYKMRLYERGAATNVSGHRVHKKCADSLVAILNDLLKEFGEDGIKEHGLDVFGGIYNFRKSRGGSSYSKHAWGAAIDLNPNENRNKQKWSASKMGSPGYANMPVAAVEIFEKHGWKSGGRAWGRDAMHFQATQ
jgi:hypothetical protein